MRLLLSLVILAVLALAVALPHLAGPGQASRGPTGDAIGAYLRENPEVIVEALQIYQRQEQEKASAERRAHIAAALPSILSAPGAVIGGNPDGDVTIVEFFDYQCPYCKQAFEAMMNVANADGKVRIVFIEFPVLGPVSEIASRAALASIAQGKYVELHRALMTVPGQLTEERILALASDVGLDTERLEADMAAPEVTAIIEQHLSLAETLGIQGTPSFIVGTEYVGGYVEEARLGALVNQARKLAKAG